MSIDRNGIEVSSEKRSRFLHPNDVFDQIYGLNLDRRLQRWERLQKQLDLWGIRAVRFSAVDGQSLEIQRLYRGLMKTVASNRERERCRIPSQGAFGCLLSHLKIIKDAQSRGYQRILILEDDVCFHKNFLTEFQKIARLPESWKLLYLGASQYLWRSIQKYDEGFYYAHRTLGSFGVALDSSLFQPLLDLYRQRKQVVDRCLSSLQSRYPNQCFVFLPNIVIADVTQSDIQRPWFREKHAFLMKWDLESYYVPEASPYVEKLPSCSERKPIAGLTDTFACTHPQVRLPGQLTNSEICRSCQFCETPAD